MRMPLEVFVGSVLPSPLNGGQSLHVGGDHGVMITQQLHEGAGDMGVGETVEDPAALGNAIEQSGVTEQAEVPRHTRLALAEDLGDFCHSQLTPRQDPKQPQPSWLGGRTQRFEEGAVAGDRPIDVRGSLLKRCGGHNGSI